MDNAVDSEPEEFEEDKLVTEEVDEAGIVAEVEGQDTPQEVLPPTFEIAGFWRRIAAFIVDTLVVSIPFFILGFAFTDVSFALGPYGIFIGYGVFILYWGYFNSESRNGQTLGKKALKIAVISKDNKYLSIQNSFLRAIALGSVFILVEWPFTPMRFPFIAQLISAAGSIGGLVILYGLVFNRTTRQGIHDLFVKSYVVKAPPKKKKAAPMLPKIHKNFMIGISIVGALLIVGSTFVAFSNPTFGVLGENDWENMIDVQRELVAKEGVFSAGVLRTFFKSFDSGTTTNGLEINLWINKSCEKNPTYCEELFKDTVQIALEGFDVEDLDVLEITIGSRFDFGLTQGYVSWTNEQTIEDWQAYLDE